MSMMRVWDEFDVGWGEINRPLLLVGLDLGPEIRR